MKFSHGVVKCLDTSLVLDLSFLLCSVDSIKDSLVVAFSFLLLLLNGDVHVDGECKDHIEADDDAAEVPSDEVPSYPEVTIICVDVNLNDVGPVVDNHKSEESHHRG